METLVNDKMIMSAATSTPTSTLNVERMQQVNEAFNLMIGVFKECIEKIDNGHAKDPIDLFQGYISDEKYSMLKEQYNRAMQEKLALLVEDEQQQQKMSEQSLDNFLMSNRVAAKLTKMKARQLPRQTSPFLGLTGNQTASYPTPGSRDQAAGAGGANGGSHRKKRHEHKDGFGMNWNSIITMATNLSLDQVKSMLNMLVMVLGHMPIPVILREFQKYRIMVSVFFDLISAIIKMDGRYLATTIVVGVLSVLSFMNKSDKNLAAALNVAKYFHSVGANKKLGLLRLSTLVLYISYLFKFINPPPITPNDLISLAKAFLSSKL